MFSWFVYQCYYIGGTDDAATGMLGEVTKPMSYSKPVEKICENLKKKDGQICELQYGKCAPIVVYARVKVVCLAVATCVINDGKFIPKSWLLDVE